MDFEMSIITLVHLKFQKGICIRFTPYRRVFTRWMFASRTRPACVSTGTSGTTARREQAHVETGTFQMIIYHLQSFHFHPETQFEFKGLQKILNITWFELYHTFSSFNCIVKWVQLTELRLMFSFTGENLICNTFTHWSMKKSTWLKNLIFHDKSY